jgi:hypothetical protein
MPRKRGTPARYGLRCNSTIVPKVLEDSPTLLRMPIAASEFRVYAVFGGSNPNPLYARSMYLPVRVSTLIFSPVLMKSGA